MLTHISIRNYAIISEWNIELNNQLTVVTGESGAGKSILIDAIELGLGARADSSVIRPGCERAEIVLTLDLSQHPNTQAWMEDKAYNDDNECIIRRVINNNGRSRVSINGTPCTLNEIKELANLLFNIHGQHQNQSLLDKSYQLNILDHFAGHEKLNRNVKTVVDEWQKTKAALQRLQNNSDNFGAHIELLQYQVNELDEFALSENEYAELDVEQKKLSHAQEYFHACHSAIDKINNSTDSGNVVDLLNHICADLQSIKTEDTEIKNAAEMINNALMLAEEAHGELTHYVDHFNADPERLNEIEQRLTAVHTQARKHKVEPKDLFQHHVNLQKELSDLQNASTHIVELENKLSKLQKDFKCAAEKLTISRTKAAKHFTTLVSEKIQVLGMKGGVFDIQLQLNKDDNPHHHGAETSEFYVSANPGQPQGALTKVASGGEISRIALAIQVIASQKMVTPTLVFDEVDVGIGGNTAAVVGNILRNLGEHAQVLCITHQPQVAVCGHYHLHVEKQAENNHTTTRIDYLNAEQKTLEIARMLGGMTITEKTLANAAELMGAAEC